ncbi:MAG: DNA repair protein RadA [Planktomarina sp.]|nr:DNA repair protein RadA [Planktomarina sp.]
MPKLSYTCSECNAHFTKWSGQCDACGAWNTLIDTGPLTIGPTKTLGKKRGELITLMDLDSEEKPPRRTQSGVVELDQVLGGGIVDASAILLGGDPGIGKSTLLLQAAARFARNGLKVIYISGEEATAQVRLRAQRLGITDSPLILAAETNLRNIVTTLDTEKPNLVIIDSIQTMWVDHIDAAPGSVSQVRSSAHELTSFAKRRNVSVIMVGHVTKDGQIAGPRVVEHMVDTVLYFEGERNHQFRLLRAVKNRFGPNDEIGVFEMTAKGLVEVKNPSVLFLSERGKPTSGSAIFAGIEGTRAVLCEFQALVATSPHSQPRRSVVGWDTQRLSMILAVLEARCGISFSGLDVYMNVAGGMRITEPAADLAVAAALISARYDTPLPDDTIIFGEISLSAALRPVAQTDGRLKEAQKLGFHNVVAPISKKSRKMTGIKILEMSDLKKFVEELFGSR